MGDSRWLNALRGLSDGTSTPLCRQDEATRGDGLLRLWALDATEKPSPKSYDAIVPFDTFVLLAVLGMLCGTVVFAITASTQDSHSSWHPSSSDLYCYSVLPGLLLCLVAFLWQTPRRLRREADAFVLEFPLVQRSANLSEVLELAVVENSWEFAQLLSRWSIFPFGSQVRFFCGLPSLYHSAVCVVLTSQTWWSFAFCLEDVGAFLIDNQRPLDLRARYRTCARVLVRAGEMFETAEIGNVRRGRRLQVLRQVGKRVNVRFEDPRKDEVAEGWMSYVSKHGHFLLSKEPGATVSEGNPCMAPAPGAVGASELMRGYGTTELRGVELVEVHDLE